MLNYEEFLRLKREEPNPVRKAVAILDSSLLIEANVLRSMKVIKRAVDMRLTSEEQKEICQGYVNRGWHAVTVDYSKASYMPTFSFLQDEDDYINLCKKLGKYIVYKYSVNEMEEY